MVGREALLQPVGREALLQPTKVRETFAGMDGGFRSGFPF
jgi:hypothetical protein